MESLDAELWDNGENWSMGERQMLCLARALLKPSRVVILDESFSSVDQTAEEKLVEILNDNFLHSTVFLITHRLDQVLQFDKIMVMQQGALVEYGTAAELAANSDSVFYEFLETTLLTF
uniref:ABC transporter domain-containing protein n=1 Tax=Globisporangium ultimum (strain ATCC 200006 / CBS 805.95 / DAOM BR144) TaxID=431595 RepID=K3WED1_GLOUD